ncbi:MAG TPA: beta-1,6-N-acetylglucosaminyltransferase [Steroidobacteraceae bacterium]|nr:beta-1,6-N-acetylglucosaminyltransferase [Steroidobacteraceae bacterium]
MRICYLILLHHKFDQALRLIRRLSGPDSGFVVHIDAAADPLGVQSLCSALKSLPIVYAERTRSRWGSYRQALAVMRCVRAAACHTEPFDRYVLLSGQDYPIARRAEIHEFFRRNAHVEYVEAFPLDVTDPTVPGWSPYYRFRRYHLWIGRRHLKLPLLRKPPPPVPIHHGSTWWALTRGALMHVAEQFEMNAPLRRYLRSGFLVDEVYVPTLLSASPFAARIAGHNVTYAEWTSTSGPHPKTLRAHDLQALLASPKLFARKFDLALDGAVLEELDKMHRADPMPRLQRTRS